MKRGVRLYTRRTDGRPCNPDQDPVQPGPKPAQPPRAPPGLSTKAKAIWRDTLATYELNAAEQELLALALRHRDLADEALSECKRFGLTLETGSGGMRRANPAHKVAIDSLRSYRATLKDLGIVPEGAESYPNVYPGWTEEWGASFDNSLENRGLPGSFIEMGLGWAQASMAPSRMFKGFTAEGGIRSPFIAKMPGTQANAGALNHSFFHVRDVMPTILDLASIEHPNQIDGREVMALQGQSVLDMLDGSAEAPYSGASQVGYELFGLKAFFDGDWKILWMPPPFGSGDWELYNLSVDPAELNDLASDHPERLASMVEMWERYKVENTVLDAASLDLSDAI